MSSKYFFKMFLENLDEVYLLIGITIEVFDTNGSETLKVSIFFKFVSIFENNNYFYRNLFFSDNTWHK